MLELKKEHLAEFRSINNLAVNFKVKYFQVLVKLSGYIAAVAAAPKEEKTIVSSLESPHRPNSTMLSKRIYA